MTVNLNICLAADLILMIKYPFTKKESRLPLYLAVSVSVALALSFAVVFTAAYRPEYEYVLPVKFVAACTMTVLILYFIVAFASIVYAIMKLCQPGISKESQKLVLVRHVLCIIGFIIAQLYVFISFGYMIFPNWFFDK